MMTLWVAFVCGLVLGGIGGVLLMCLFFVAKRSDSYVSTMPVAHPQDVLSVVKHMNACCPDAVSVVALPAGVLPPCPGRAFSEGC